MIVNILTFHFALNAGAVLQCFALSTYLKEMGHDVKVINYRPTLVKKISARNLGKYLLLYPFNVWQQAQYKAFLNKNIQQTKRCNTIADISQLPQADIYIVGSDQIWNPDLVGSLDDAYFLNFTTSGKKVSYAASAGNDTFPEAILKAMAEKVKKLDCVSVREWQLKAMLEGVGVQKIKHVLDPVFLLEKEKYEAMARCATLSHRKYVLVYYNDKSGLDIKLAKRIAQERNCIVINISKMYKQNGVFPGWCSSPQAFLSYFQHADYIVTSSFHGCAFSIIFRKPFYAISTSNRSSRISSLLASIGLENRLINEKQLTPEKITEIYYKDIEEKLEARIKASKEFLALALQNT